jgi:hypothetical protein
MMTRMKILSLLGAGFGAALLLRPRAVLSAVGADPDLPGLIPAARILGARHLVQGVILAVAPARVARWSASIDGLHAASMYGLAVVAPDYRRAALVSAGVASALGGGVGLRRKRS